MFSSEETKRKSPKGIEVYYTRSRIRNLVTGLIMLMILALLVIPIYLLFHLVNEIGAQKTNAACIGVLLAFTLAFSAVLSLFTRAKRHEVLAAAAGSVYELPLQRYLY
jgi:ABC-type glycerol-3-phosphate transport system permease component